MAGDTSPVLLSSFDLRSIFSPKPCRVSTQPKPVQSPVMSRPRTSSSCGGPGNRLQWKKALAEVKREYVERRYRSCSNKCQDLLAAAKVNRTAEAVHLVYLHFYAANSLEMQVRSLHHASTYRVSLLDCARDHYRRASVLAEAEGQIAARALYPRSNSVTSSHSSMPSLSSSRSSRASSPALSAADDLDYGRSRQVMKQVRFKMTPEIPQEPLEPFVRPDSPTLGSDDMFGMSSPEEESETETPLLELFPKAPSQICEPRFPPPSPAVDEIREEIMEATRQRYASCLAALHHQIVTVHLPAIADGPSIGPSPPSNSSMRAMEAQTRIQRLKSDGWRRKRFDSAKYETLRESALADLME